MTWPENVISLTEPEFAQLVNVSRRTIARERQAGRLPFSEIGPRDLRYTRTDLETWLQNTKRGITPPKRKAA